MRAVITDGEGNVWSEQRERPEPGPAEALVRVHAVGICGSDLGLIRGEGPPWTDYPVVPGHEVAGEVVETGHSVSAVSVGDRVALHGFVFCGVCDACREGRYYQCDQMEEVGFSRDGGYQEYTTVPAYTLKPLPDTVSYTEATQVDPAACTLHGLERIETAVTDTAFVAGPGSLGLYGVELLQALGVDDIVLSGVHDDRLAVGAELGASETINVRRENPVERVAEYTDGRGADLCLEATGAGDVVDTCLSAAAKQGHVVLTGVFGERASIAPDDIVHKELTVVGGVTAAHAVDDVLTLLERGALSTDSVITHEFPLSKYELALETVRNKDDGVIKAILRP